MSLLFLMLCLQDFGGGDGRIPRNEPIKPEEIRAVFAEKEKTLRTEYPDRVKELEALIGEGRLRDAGRILEDLIRRYRHISDLKRRDPETYRMMKKIHVLDFECLRLSRDARHGGGELREELKRKLSALFDLREEMRAREIDVLKRRIAELEGKLGDRVELKDQIVERRLRELLGEKDIVEW